MKIEGEPGQELPEVVLWLNRSEAAELRDLLAQMLEEPETETDPEWHAHVSDAEFRKTITVTWERM